MYEFIRGFLVEAQEGVAVLDVAGIGYKIFIPANAHLEAGKEVFLYIQFIIREQEHSLYGFTHKEERNLFIKLLSVSGIGPKTALSLIGHLGSDFLLSSIHKQDVKALCKIPGVGKKTAERLILEIKDRIPPALPHPYSHDGILALINLGYSREKAEQAMQKAMHHEKTQDTALLIREALKHC